MKKNIVLCTLAAIVAFSAGWFSCLKVNTDSVESFNFKFELISTQQDALDKAWVVMSNNNVFEVDNSGDMEEYLKLQCKVDSLLMSQL